MKKIMLLVLSMVFLFCANVSADTYELCVAFDHDDQPQLVLMRDWTAAGMNYPETVDDGDGNQIPNPVSELAHIKTMIKLFVFQNMRRGQLLTDGQTVLDDHMTIWDGVYEPKVVSVP